MKKLLIPLAAVVLCAAILFGTNAGFASVRAENAGKEHIAIMKTLLPGGENFTVEEYNGDNATIRSVHKGETGYVIETITNGYAGKIRMLIGVSNEGKVVGLVVRELHETRGLGSRALTDTDFLSQLLCTSGDAEVGVNVDALTGATVTSKAVVRSVNAAVGFVTGADTSSGATASGADASSGATS